jgi:hypothetical protein
VSEREAAAPETGRQPRESPPPGGSWARLYAIVLAGLAADLLLLWWFTEHYR